MAAAYENRHEQSCYAYEAFNMPLVQEIGERAEGEVEIGKSLSLVMLWQSSLTDRTAKLLASGEQL